MPVIEIQAVTYERMLALRGKFIGWSDRDVTVLPGGRVLIDLAPATLKRLKVVHSDPRVALIWLIELWHKTGGRDGFESRRDAQAHKINGGGRG